MPTIPRSLTGFIVISAAILTAGCSTLQTDGSDPGAQAIVRNVTWEWTETVTPNRRIGVDEPDRYTLRFRDSGEAQIRFDCNHGGSYYEISGSNLTFGPLTATRIHCGEGSQGPIYMRQLAVVVSYFTRDEFLFLELTEESGTMRFRRSGDR